MTEHSATSDSPDGNLRKQEVDDLREKFIRIATAAADASAGELTLVASTLTDLMTIAQTSGDLENEHSTSLAISEYCQSTLPAIESALSTYPDVDDSITAILDDIESNWGEYLDLLSEHERFHAKPADSWNSSLESSWEPESTLEVSEEEPDADGAFEQVDVSAILNTLGQLAAPSPAAPPKEVSPFAETKSTHSPPPPVAEAETIDDPELLTAYLDDAQQCLGSMENCVLELDKDITQVQPLQQFCRELHTLKGASATVGLSGLASYLHGLENDVEAMTQPGTTVNTDPLLEGIDSVRHQLEKLLGQPVEDGKKNSSQPIAAPPSMDAGFTNNAEGVVRLETSRLDRLMDLLAELVMLRNRRDTYVNSLQDLHHEINACATRIRVLDTMNVVHQQQSDAPPLEEEQNPAPLSKTLLHDLNSRLAEISKDVTEIGRTLHAVFDPLAQDNSGISHLIGRFRNEMMELRRQPVAGLFRRLQRVARETSKMEQKPVELVLHGEGTRAERSLQDRLFEPLMHIVRNAISHGIESAEERDRKGKPKTGRIQLKSWSDATSLYVEVRDDGRGLNEEKLEKKGRELGLIRVGEQFSKEELWNLILHSGFSTKQVVNQVSGRGVGMDVVASQIREMRGRLVLDSVDGQYTSIRMQIPLRSTIEHAMVVKVGPRLFALPMHSIDGTEADQSEFADANLVSLQFLLGLTGPPAASPRAIRLRHQEKASKSTNDQERTAQKLTILVDSVVGVEEVVVRSLPPLIRNHDCFSGVTLSGQAETVLVLDVPRLVEWGLNSLNSYATYAEENTPEALKRKRLIENRQKGLNIQNSKILVVDDSLSVRKSLVKKLEKHGYETIEAADGLQAISLLRNNDCVGVISDVDMPKMNGIDFLSELRRHNRFADLPFVVVTSRKDDESIHSLESLGATRIFPKPVSDTTVNMIVRAIRDHNRCNPLVIS